MVPKVRNSVSIAVREILVPHRVERRVLGPRRQHVDVQPVLDEVGDEALRLACPPSMRVTCVSMPSARRQLSRGGRGEQRRVRHRAPQEVRQAVGDLVVAELHDRAVFDRRAGIHLPVIEEAGRLQHRLEQQHDRAVEVERQRRARRLVQRVERRRSRRSSAAAGTPWPERGDEHAGAARLGGRVRRRAGQDRRQLGRRCSSPASLPRSAGWRRRASRSRSAGGTGNALLLRSSDSPGTSSSYSVVSASRSRTVARYSRERQTPQRASAPAEFGSGGPATDPPVPVSPFRPSPTGRPRPCWLPPIAPSQPAPSRIAQRRRRPAAQYPGSPGSHDVSHPPSGVFWTGGRAPPPKATNT